MRILIGGILLLSLPALAADLSAQMSQCRQLTDNTARLQCYDQLPLATAIAPVAASPSTPANITTPTAVAQVQPTSSATPVQTQAETEFEFGKRLARPVDEVEKITSPIKTIKYNLQKKALIQLENGQVWQQLENVQMNLYSGKECSVQRAALGSFLFKCNGSSKTMRVTRLE